MLDINMSSEAGLGPPSMPGDNAPLARPETLLADGGSMAGKSDVLQGTLDLMVLKTLDVMGPLHGYGLARRIEQVSDQALALNQGTLYPALVRLEQRGWIGSAWGVSDSGRRARFYSLTRAGRRQLQAETDNWRATSRIMSRFLEAEER